MLKKIISTAFIACILFSSFGQAFAKEALETEELAPNSRSAILIERDTGTVIYENNSDAKLPPASMTKMMTMLLIMDALDSKQIKLTDMVKTSEYAASMGGSQIFLEPGEEMTVEQMLNGIAIGSANDACVAMAEKISGSEEAFIKAMNERAKEIGLKNTNFVNCTGLPAENHYSSAKDMAILGRELLSYPEITKYTGTYESFLREGGDKQFWLVNTNKLVKHYPGVDGLKTGFTAESKYCLTATAKKNDMRLIAVVFGAETPKDRNAQISKMLDFGFNQYTVKPIVKKGEEFARIPVLKGSKRESVLVAKDNLSVLLKQGEDASNYKTKVTLNKYVNAPVKGSQVLGEVVIENNGKVVSSTELVSKEKIESASYLELVKRSAAKFSQIPNN